MYLRNTLLFFLCILSSATFSQTDSTTYPITISGYAEVYYSYDFSKPNNHERPNFYYSFNRANEVNLNLGFIKASYIKDGIRANLALMTGTYSNANLANEPGVLQFIYEANVGVRLTKNKKLWMDAGIFESHIGFETAIGKNNDALTRSIVADNSPYYETGVKLAYKSDNDKWFLSLLYLNGWQVIQRPDNFSTPAFGHQITYTPSSKISINSSSFAGSNTPDSTNEMRYYHNLYSIIQLHPKIVITMGFDIGAQQNAPKSFTYNIWYSPQVLIKKIISKKFSISLRGEYYNDENQVIIKTGTANGFQTFGYSLNLDFNITPNTIWRIEGKRLTSKDAIFTSASNNASFQNCAVSSSLAIVF